MPNDSPSRTYRPLVLVLLVLCLAVSAGLVYNLRGLRADVQQQSERYTDVLWSVQMQMLTTSWTSGGSTYTVTTNRREAETATDFVARHDEVVAASQALHPPDNP